MKKVSIILILTISLSLFAQGLFGIYENGHADDPDADSTRLNSRMRITHKF